MARQVKDDKTTWQPVNVSTLSPEQAKLYKVVRDAAEVNAKAYKALKAAEDACTLSILAGQTPPTGQMYKVAFRYGLAIALVPHEDAKAKAGTLSLADYLAANAA